MKHIISIIINVFIYVIMLLCYTIVIAQGDNNNVYYEINRFHGNNIISPKYRIFNGELTLQLLLTNVNVDYIFNKNEYRDNDINNLAIASINVNDPEKINILYICNIQIMFHKYYNNDNNQNRLIKMLYYDYSIDDNNIEYALCPRISETEVDTDYMNLIIANIHSNYSISNGCPENIFVTDYDNNIIPTPIEVKHNRLANYNHQDDGERDLIISRHDYDEIGLFDLRNVKFVEINHNNIVLLGNNGIMDNKNIWIANIERFEAEDSHLYCFKKYFSPNQMKIVKLDFIARGNYPEYIKNSDSVQIYYQNVISGNINDDEQTIGQIALSTLNNESEWMSNVLEFEGNDNITWYNVTKDDINKTIFLLMSKNESGDEHLFITMSEDNGKTWYTPVRITSGNVVDTQPSIIAYQERIYVAYIRSSGENDKRLIYGYFSYEKLIKLIKEATCNKDGSENVNE